MPTDWDLELDTSFLQDKPKILARFHKNLSLLGQSFFQNKLSIYKIYVHLHQFLKKDSIKSLYEIEF